MERQQQPCDSRAPAPASTRIHQLPVHKHTPHHTFVKAMQLMSAGVSPASAIACCTSCTAHSWWCSAVSRGRKPCPGGVMNLHVCMGGRFPEGGLVNGKLGGLQQLRARAEPPACPLPTDGGQLSLLALCSHVCRGLLRISPSSRTMPTPILLALPSMPSAISMAALGCGGRPAAGDLQRQSGRRRERRQSTETCTGGPAPPSSTAAAARCASACAPCLRVCLLLRRRCECCCLGGLQAAGGSV